MQRTNKINYIPELSKKDNNLFLNKCDGWWFLADFKLKRKQNFFLLSKRNNNATN